jgi:lactoylglutathione lyase
MQLDDARIGIVGTHWPERMLGTGLGSGPRYELFVFVDDVDAAFHRARAAGVEVRHEPETMPWGERIAYVADPEGNPVAFAAPNATRA